MRPLGNLCLTSRDSEVLGVNRGFLFILRLLPRATGYLQGKQKNLRLNKITKGLAPTEPFRTTIATQIAFHMCAECVRTYMYVHMWRPEVNLSHHSLDAVHPGF